MSGIEGCVREEFRGYVLGLRGQEVEEVLRTHDLSARCTVWSPILAIALGIPRERLLRGPRTPRAEVLYARLALFGTWAIVAPIALFTLASFLYGPWAPYRIDGLIVTLGAAGLAVAVTAFVARYLKQADIREEDSFEASDFPWPFLFMSPEVGLFVLVFVLVLLLTLFLVFVVWVPLVFVVLNLLTLGKLWRTFRTVFVVADADDRSGLQRAGHDLLRRGAVLSHTWDSCLDSPDIMPALGARKRLLRFHRSLILLAGASLLLAATFGAARFLSFTDETPILIAEATAALGAFVYFVLVILRTQGTPASAAKKP